MKAISSIVTKKPSTFSIPLTEGIKIISTYDFKSGNIPITVKIYTKKDEFVPIYAVSISSISKTTELVLEKIRKEIIEKVNLGMVDIIAVKKTGVIEEEFSKTINALIKKYERL